ncbi:hypothetical protein [Klebsiella quasivariicola]|uniref:hypothetical protein n=1 Tax=Klebsiella quasivariicola TaxID=2026240 RepID=UPI00115C9E25|nr:hypothetical protein [Klebsiella quasivariicola]
MRVVGNQYNKRHIWQPGELKAYLAEQRALTRASRERAEEWYQFCVLEAERASRKRSQLSSIVKHTVESERLQRAGTHQDIFTVTEELDQQYEDCIRAINVPLVLEGVHK